MAQIREELVLYDRFTDTFTRYIKQSEQAAAATKSAERATESFQASQRSAAGAVNDLTGRLMGLVGTYVGVQGLKNLLDLSDTMASNTARLDMMNDGLQTTEELNEMIMASAQRSRGAYLDTANLVAKLGTLAGDAFGSSAEVVAFAEQINKQIALSGASSTAASAAMLQLIQGLSSGVLRGEELNSILEQTPTIAQTIADYLGVTTGEMRELASEGKVTAEVVKNAMFAAADETNAKFEEMPMTWGQVWEQMKNDALETFQPLLEAVGNFAQWVGENLETIMPILYSVAAAVGVLVAAFAIWKVVTLAMAAAQWVMNSALLACPLTWIVLAIAVIVGAIVAWINAVGGLEIAMLIAQDTVMTVIDVLKTGIMFGVYAIQNWLDQLVLGVKGMVVNVQNFFGNLKVGVLNILQSMVNGAIDIINGFIGVLNAIPGVSINTIEHVTFGTTAALEEQAAQAQRAADLEAAADQVRANIAQRAADHNAMYETMNNDHLERQLVIAEKQRAQEEAAEDSGFLYEDMYTQVSGIGESVSGIEKAVSAADEDLKSLVDVAERRYVNRINLTAQTPVINVSGQNTGNNEADRRALADAIRDILVEQAAYASIRSTYAPVYG